MKIINKTDWNTRDLQKICRKILKHEGADKVTRTITIVYSRGGRMRGLASLGYPYRIKMKVPSPKHLKHGNTFLMGSDSSLVKTQAVSEFPVKSFAQVFTHEVHHNLMLNHEDMAYCSSLDVSYTDGMTVDLKPQKPKTGRNYSKEVEKRKSNVEDKVKAWERKLRLAKTKLKFWQGKRKYYEKKEVE